MSCSNILAAGLIAAFGFGSSAMACSPPVTGPAPARSTSQANQPPSKADPSAIKPGGRMCLRHTGSLIPPKPGECINAVGTSYSAQDVRRTGEPDTARALQMLDPRIRLGH